MRTYLLAFNIAVRSLGQKILVALPMMFSLGTKPQ
jgi:hypothetical protein